MLPTDAERPIAGQLTLLQWADLPRGAGTSSAPCRQWSPC